MARLLAFTSPAPGHVLPLAPGLRALADRGHDVRLVVDDQSAELIRELELTTIPMDPAIRAIRVDDHLAKGDLERLSRGVEGLMARGTPEREQLSALVEELAPDLLIVDFNAYGASTFAAASGLPWALSFPTLVPLPERGLPPYGPGLRPMGGPVGRLRDSLVERIIMRTFNRAMLPGINRLRGEVGLEPLAHVLDHMATADRFLAMTGAPLEYPRSEPPAWLRFVGASNYDPPAEAPAWLSESGDPWVLVTCSTEYQGDERLAATAIEALRDRPVRVLVTLGDADASQLPTAPNARVERFVPHSAVLPHAAAVITHGGMGIVQKAIGAAVPLVVVPFGRDQPEVARRVTEAGAGVSLRLRQLRADRLRAAVDRAMGMQESATVAARRQRAAGGAGAFADAVEELLLERGLAPAALALDGVLA